MAPRARLDSETEIARIGVRVEQLEKESEAGEREHERLQEDYGKVIAALAGLESDVKVIRSQLDTAEKSSAAGPGLLGVTVVLAQALAEVVKYFLHLHQ